MEYSFDYAFDGGIGWLILWILYMLAAGVFGIAWYVFRGYGVFSIAKNRGIRHPWFAWIPVLNQYLLGCIADQYQYVAKGRVKNRRKVLLILNLVLIAMHIAFYVAYGVLIGGTIRAAMGGLTEYQILDRILRPALTMLGALLPILGVALAITIFRYIALYDLYTSCSPDNSILFLVLSIVFRITEPFFIFFNRKKEDGMPPRKRKEPEVIQQPIYEQEGSWNAEG